VELTDGVAEAAVDRVSVATRAVNPVKVLLVILPIVKRYLSLRLSAAVPAIGNKITDC
jgi:hypothetical protein